MPACPTCATVYPPGTRVCGKDGSTLSATGGGAPSEISSAPTLSQTEAAATAVAAPAFDPMVGSTLAGRYSIARKIGEGGMGAVYEGNHAVIGKRVAVKVLLEKFHGKTDLVARLLQEARLASSIGHEHIIDVTDFGTTDDGRSFVVMEFLEGESLAQLAMREAPLPVERSLRICRQVAGALAAAHAKGILHRDVKPENVYLVRRADADFVKVVDFGISKAVRQGDDSAESHRLTTTGMVLGTPLYMSPEQARGNDDLDHRADIWALGVMMYECLTGEVPFRANNYLGIISQVLTHDPPPPSKLRPELGIPESVEAVVMRAMHKDRDKRYQSMAELERDLGRLLAGDQNVGVLGIPALAAAAKGGARWWMIAGVAAVLVVGVGVAAGFTTSEPPARPPSTGASAPVAAPRSAPRPPPPAAPPGPSPVASEAPSQSGEPRPARGRRRQGPAPSPASPAPGSNVGAVIPPDKAFGPR